MRRRGVRNEFRNQPDGREKSPPHRQGESMKRVIIFTAALLVASWATAQTSNQAGAQGQGQNPPPQGTQAQPGAQGQAGAAGAQAQPGPAPKRPPQAKTQEEFKAFQTAAASATPDAQEK